MAIGPVQLIVPGFDHPDFRGEIIAELERLRESDTVRVIDSLAVYKDADGELEVQHLSHLSTEEAIELGSTIDALIGLGIEGEEGVTKCFPAHPTTTKALRLQGLRDAPKRTRASTRLSRTRPSTWSPRCQMRPLRVRASDLCSGVDDMDASDTLDVAADVATQVIAPHRFGRLERP